MLFPTPPDQLCDQHGRPYFLWDVDLTLDDLRRLLVSPDESERLYWIGAVLRQAKPDDAIVLLGKEAILQAVPKLVGRLGTREAMWVWLVGTGFTVTRVETTPAFCRLLVADQGGSLPIDLVADVTPTVEAAREIEPGVWVDTPREILANKLTALLSRWAVRDLVDARALVAHGVDLDQGLLDAARKDAGLSGPMLAWVLQTTPDTGLDDDLRAFKRTLIDRLAPR
jgi:hypothetical protein